MHSGLLSALLYNRAQVLASSSEKAKQQQAVDRFEEYLVSSSSAGAWWPLAYEKYSELCERLGRTPRKKTEFTEGRQPRWRLVSSVQLASGATLALSEPLQEASTRLGDQAPPPQRTKLERRRYPEHGVEVLATDRILAICLIGDKAPHVQLREVGLGAKPAELHLKMPEKELNSILGDEPYELRPLDDPKVNYRFYPRLGLAVRLQDQKVSDLVVAQIPRKGLGD